MTRSSALSQFRRTVLALTAGCVLAAAVCTTASAQTSPPIGAFTTAGSWSFVTAPNLHPPKVTADVRTRGVLAPGFFMAASFPNLTTTSPMFGQAGPLILDSRLQPVWFLPLPTSVVPTDLSVQTYNGKPVLSWWQGVVTNTGASISGQIVAVDQHYRRVAALTAPTSNNPAGCSGVTCWIISVHDEVISGHDIWVTVYRVVPGQNLSQYGGSSSAPVYDSGVQEYDLRTGKLLDTWDALNPGGTPNIPLSDSETHPPPSTAFPWDAYHINSVQLVGANEFLVSMRNAWAGYLINATTGKVIWKLGGDPAKPSTYRVASNAQFEWQHDLHTLPGNEVEMFDDHCCALVGPGKFAPPTAPSRGLVLKLNNTTHTASLVASYGAGLNRNAAFLGNTQVLPGGNAVVGWGSTQWFSEFSPSGKMLLDGVWPGNGKDLSYRVFVQKWVGTPFFAPSGALKRKGRRATVYASWDGATEVASWEVLAGPDARHLVVVAVKPKLGFETAISVGKAGRSKVFKVRALDRRGRVLGTSGPFPKHKRATSLPGAY